MSSVSIDDTLLPVAEPAVAEQWETIEEEQEAASFGMWLFLATEMLFFGGLFLCYTVYRFTHTDGFLAGARATDLKLGTMNTVILLTSSLSVATSITAMQKGQRKLSMYLLMATMILGLLFLVNKGFEWATKIEHGIYPNSPTLLARSKGEILFFGLPILLIYTE